MRRRTPAEVAQHSRIKNGKRWTHLAKNGGADQQVNTVGSAS